MPAAAPRSAIDIHFHMLPAFYTDAARAAGKLPTISGGFPQWTPGLALELMDRQGIATAITSISQPGVHFGDDRAARLLARQCNEFAASLVRDMPQRFGAFATLPLPDVEGAREEAAYALDTLGADGVCLLASYGERFLGDPWFDPLLDELNAREAVVFLHPNFHPSSRGLKLVAPAFMVEFLFDTTRAVVNMLVSGTFERYPRIRFVLAHAGGTLPYVAWRLSVAPMIDERVAHLSQEGVFSTLRRFWYDTAQSAGPQTMGSLMQVADPARIVFGGDWPYCPESVVAETSKALDASPLLDDAQRAAIMRGNALALFPRLAGV
ncbi:amidohydrolase [Burkholderia sp. SFA1]|uniref:amidohydrolase family protein n=1 Tax=Caballeronia sp. CLC5 TaxID=2906764 RepID=UPI000238732B|nr:amidohydrolase family protein [Caballeronia sp. CLC5]AET92424.1 amidohydrolase [Burkholderia sp. YI23]MCE4573719.1 amidohydrolase [Caballeronia sp. CLC5]BBQ00564.1 amidohydrolase [Burkholderia sp. SFA1]